MSDYIRQLLTERLTMLKEHDKKLDDELQGLRERITFTTKMKDDVREAIRELEEYEGAKQ